MMPSEVTDHVGAFDRFAGWCSQVASRAPFFAFCILLIAVWAPSLALLSFDTWQLIINTATTIITFLLVALIQNAVTRSDQAVQHKLNAIADALADLLESQTGNSQHSTIQFRKDAEELRAAVGLEHRESTTG